jgi:hypothetical protein
MIYHMALSNTEGFGIEIIIRKAYYKGGYQEIWHKRNCREDSYVTSFTSQNHE